jgi:hypothetical protein
MKFSAKKDDAAMPKRIAAHRVNGRPFDQVFYIATSARQREGLERLLIRAINPPQNRQHRNKQDEIGVQ